jgi:hypothetical protein
MTRYTFYIPGCNQLTGLSQGDWAFLCELAAENNVPPATFAAQMLSAELERYRDEIALADEFMKGASTLLTTQN